MAVKAFTSQVVYNSLLSIKLKNDLIILSADGSLKIIFKDSRFLSDRKLRIQRLGRLYNNNVPSIFQLYYQWGYFCASKLPGTSQKVAAISAISVSWSPFCPDPGSLARCLEKQGPTFSLTSPETGFPAISSPSFVLSSPCSLCHRPTEDNSCFENWNMWNIVPVTKGSIFEFSWSNALLYLQHDKYPRLCSCLGLCENILDLYLKIFEGTFSFSIVFIW